jgi:hypothetical protein
MRFNASSVESAESQSKVAALGEGAFRSLQLRCDQPFCGKSAENSSFAEDAAGTPRMSSLFSIRCKWQAACIDSCQSMH